jgi:hypothetical protein
VGTGKKARKNQKLGKHKEEDGDEATGAAEVEIAEIVVDDITPAAVSEGAEVTEIVVDEAAPATVEQEVIDMQEEEGIVEATAPHRAHSLAQLASRYGIAQLMFKRSARLA